MEKKLFEDKDPDQRRQILRDSCDKAEEFTYEKGYTNQDVEEFIHDVSSVVIEIDRMESDLAKIKKVHTDMIKPKKIHLKALMENIRFRSRTVKEIVYIFIDHEANKVGYYTEEGMLVNERFLNVDEHQRTIMGVSREQMEENEDWETVEEVK